MSTPVETVPTDMRLDEARAMMHARGVHHLIVTDHGKVAGALSESEFINANTRHPGEALRAADVMSLNVATVDRDDTVRRAANLMRGRNVGCLAVTGKGHLVGIVTVSDLLTLLGKGGERRVPAERASLHFRVAHRRQRNGSRW
jgi:CBS domain-containing protein